MATMGHLHFPDPGKVIGFLVPVLAKVAAALTA